MDIDDDDDFYAPDDAVPEIKAETAETEEKPAIEANPESTEDKDLEEGEEEEGEELDGGEDGEEDEEDSDDSDIEVITERKEGTKPPPPTTQSRYNTISIAPNKPSTPTTAKSNVAQTKKETTSHRTVTAPSGGGDLPAVSTSKLDINAKPIYPPAGKPITAVEIDTDLPDNDKPWRRPGADVSDYFNYGFDEFTWALYATKQENLRSEFSPDKVAQNSKKMMEEMSSIMMMGGMPMPGMPGMAPDGGGMTPEMMAMMQQMMGSGMDPSQMSEQMFAGMQTGGGAGQGVYGQGYGYDQSNMNGGGGGAGGAGGGGRGNFGGGGRGRRGGRGW